MPADARVLPQRPDRIVVIGVLNVTPDSFSDGGRFDARDAAVTQAQRMWAEGADLVDVGGESTRPGAAAIDECTEADRVLPVVRELVAAGIAVSVDTYRAGIADAALDAGATVVNDVSGGLGDPRMLDVVRAAGCPWILMHWRGPSAGMAGQARYGNVVEEVRAELVARVDAVTNAGVAVDRLVLDPGLGFAKTAEHNWTVLNGLGRIVDIGLPVLVGASRKSFLGAALADGHGQARPVDQREAATAAITAYSALASAWGVRVHDVRANVDAARTVAAILHGGAAGGGSSPTRG